MRTSVYAITFFVRKDVAKFSRSALPRSRITGIVLTTLSTATPPLPSRNIIISTTPHHNSHAHHAVQPQLSRLSRNSLVTELPYVQRRLSCVASATFQYHKKVTRMCPMPKLCSQASHHMNLQTEAEQQNVTCVLESSVFETWRLILSITI